MLVERAIRESPLPIKITRLIMYALILFVGDGASTSRLQSNLARMDRRPRRSIYNRILPVGDGLDRPVYEKVTNSVGVPRKVLYTFWGFAL